MFGKVGFTRSGVYPIDPDGKSQNQPPIEGHCSLPDGKTTIGEYLFDPKRKSPSKLLWFSYTIYPTDGFGILNSLNNCLGSREKQKK